MISRMIIIICVFLMFSANCLAEKLWGDEGLFLGHNSQDSHSSTRMYQGINNSLILTYLEFGQNGSGTYQLQVVNNNGDFVLENPIPLCQGDIFSSPKMYQDGNNGLIYVTYESIEDELTVYLHHLDGNLNRRFQERGIPIFQRPEDAQSAQMNDVIFSDEIGYTILVRESYFLGDVYTSLYKIYKYQSDGEHVEDFPEDGLTIWDESDYLSNSGFQENCLWLKKSIRRNDALSWQFNLYDIERGMIFDDSFNIPSSGLIFQDRISSINSEIRMSSIGAEVMYFLCSNISNNNTINIYLHRIDHEGPTFDDFGYLLFSYPRQISSEGTTFRIFPFELDGEEYIYFYSSIREDNNTVRYLNEISLLRFGDRDFVNVWNDPISLVSSTNGKVQFVDNNIIISMGVMDEIDGERFGNGVIHKIDIEGNLLYGDEGLHILNEPQRRSWGTSLTLIPKSDGGFYGKSYWWRNEHICNISDEGDFLWENRFRRLFDRGIGSIVSINRKDEYSARILYHRVSTFYYRNLGIDGEFTDEPIEIIATDSSNYNPDYCIASSESNTCISYGSQTGDHGIVVLNEDGSVFPEDGPLDAYELFDSGVQPKLIGDSLGLFWISSTINGIPRISKLTERCEWHNRINCIPFPNRRGSFNLYPRNDGSAWVTLRRDDSMLMQIISNEIQLQLEEPVDLFTPDFVSDVAPDFTGNSQNEFYRIFKHTEHYRFDDNVMKYDEFGQPQWEEPVVIFDPQPAGEWDSFVAHRILFKTDANGDLWFLYVNIAQRPARGLCLQKLSRGGNKIFGDQGFLLEDVELEDVENDGSEVNLQPDHDGGMWISWMELVEGGLAEPRALHLNADGNLVAEGGFEDIVTFEGVVAFAGRYESPNGAYSSILFPNGCYCIVYNVGHYMSCYRAQCFGNPNGVSQSNLMEPIEFSLHNIYPNPFNSSIRISYGLPIATNVNINIYDLTGRLVDVLVSGSIKAGNHTAVWDARDTASGIYMCRLEANGVSKSRKLILTK